MAALNAACDIVVSDIIHTRHGGDHHPASHVLRRSGLSIWIDLDQLAEANRQSLFFSVDRFNLLGFQQRDHGPNFKSNAPLVSLGDYVRQIAAELIPEKTVKTAHLLTFPRILGVGFTPLSVYVACDAAGLDLLYIYEVRNTFGDMHAYIGTPSSGAAILEADKIFHVSPFFPVEGCYRLRLRLDARSIKLAMRYLIADRPALTATMRGTRMRLGTGTLLYSLFAARQFPFRPIISIHFEALKLWLKKLPFFPRPIPPTRWSRAKDFDKAN